MPLTTDTNYMRMHVAMGMAGYEEVDSLHGLVLNYEINRPPRRPMSVFRAYVDDEHEKANALFLLGGIQRWTTVDIENIPIEYLLAILIGQNEVYQAGQFREVI